MIPKHIDFDGTFNAQIFVRIFLKNYFILAQLKSPNHEKKPGYRIVNPARRNVGAFAYPWLS